MCNALPDPKFLLRETEARTRAARSFAAQDHDISPQTAPVRLAALRLWWQRVATRMLRKDVPNV
jgi:hypothetical protein